MRKSKTNISVADNTGARRTVDLILGDATGYASGDILDANAVEKKINDIVGIAPEDLDTIAEAAEAIVDMEQDITELLRKLDPAINITYSELKFLRDNSSLVPGQFYRITDYVTTTTQNNTQSAGHQFDIIVRADDVNVLNESAYAAHHAGDTYFANSKLEAWRLLYCLDNDTSRFLWAGGKSITISNKNYYRNKTNDVSGATYPYCWSSDSSERFTASDTPSTGDNAYLSSTGGTSYTISSVNEETGKGVIYRMIDEFDNDCPYDFKNIQFKVGVNTTAGTVANVFYYTFSVALGTNDATVTDHSLNGSSCYNNRIGKWITNSTQKLNFNVFRNTSTIAFCNNNTFGNNCYSNIFGNSCSRNTFGNNCNSNTFGNNCNSNTFGNYCSDNAFGNNCSSNIFGNSCSSNTFGNYCYSNIFGNYCYSNIFGNNCSSNKFLKDYSYYIIIENDNQNISITSTQTTSSSNKLRNITVAQGVNNTATTKTISHNTVNDTFQTVYQPANSQTISV